MSNRDTLMAALDSQDWIPDAALVNAIELRFSECFGAMNIANALGGSSSSAWKLVRSVTPTTLLDEAKARGIDYKAIKGAVSNNPIVETNLFKKCCEEIPNLA